MLVATVRAQAQDMSVLISRNASVCIKVPESMVARMTREAEAAYGSTDAHAQMATKFKAAGLEVASSLVSAYERLHALRPRPALVHPANDPLPFSDPFDASVATASRATRYALRPPIETLRIYASFVTGAGAEVPLTAFALPSALAYVRSIELRVFDPGVLTPDTKVVPSAAGRVSLDFSAERSPGGASRAAMVLAGHLVAFGAGWCACLAQDP
jgi:hypothetical protein